MKVLVAPAGRWRTQLLFRGYGLCVFLTTLHQYHWSEQLDRRSIAPSWDVLQRHLTARPVEEHLVSAAALALLILGARGAVLLVAAVSMALLVRLNMAEPWLFPAVEYVLFAVLPVLGVAAIAGEWLRAMLTRSPCDVRAEHVDRTVVACFRVGFLTTMGFATLHKLNTDFLDPTTSCENVIAGWLAENWGWVGTLVQRVGSPWATVLVEGGVSLLVVVWPAVGIVAVSGFFLMLGLVGAPSTAGIVMVMSWAFVDDGALVRVRPYRRVIAVGTGLTVAVVAALLMRGYQGTALSREMIVLVVTLAVVPAGVALALVWAGQAGGAATLAPPAAGSRWLTRGIPLGATIMLVANGMAPYLGLRFNYSFAMWSNLRADQHRWNSLIVPSWVQWQPMSERFIEVRTVTTVPLTLPLFPARDVAVSAFLDKVTAATRQAGAHVALDVEWNHTRHVVADGAAPEQTAALLAAMRNGSRPTDRVIVHAATVTFAPSAETPADASPYEVRLEPALFSPTGFRRAKQGTARRRQNYDLELVHEGQVHRMPSTLTNPDVERFVANLPESNLLPPKLSRSGPQRCFH